MSDTVAYICMLVPMLTLLGYQSWKHSDKTLKDFLKVYLCAFLIGALFFAFIKGSFHFIGKAIPPVNQVFESPK